MYLCNILYYQKTVLKNTLFIIISVGTKAQREAL